MRRSNPIILFISCIVGFALLLHCGSNTENEESSTSGIKLIREGKSTVKVMIDGEHFTTYTVGPNNEKPIFFPVNSPTGNMINRGWPMIDSLDGEKNDHKHHQSLWFTYGEVNGVDFWGEECEPERNGKIVSTGLKTTDGKNVAGMVAYADWVMPDGSVSLKEEKEVFFYKLPDYRAMDFTIKLTAQDSAVHFGDTKEGMFGFRVTPQLKDDNDGQYINSDSLIGKDQCWGKRAAWLALRGPVKNEQVTVAIFNHPESINYPCYWHARGYGLTSANPFGRKAYTMGQEPPLELTLAPGKSIVFKARFMIYSGIMTKAELDQEFEHYKAM